MSLIGVLVFILLLYCFPRTMGSLIALAALAAVMIWFWISMNGSRPSEERRVANTHTTAPLVRTGHARHGAQAPKKTPD